MPQAKEPALVATQTRNRTDGGPASKQAQRYIAGMPNYGDGQELANLQASAPMSKMPNPPAMQPALSGSQGGQAQAQQALTGLLAPTQRPNEPVTTGAPSGAGLGPAALGINTYSGGTGQSAKQVVQTMAMHPDASPELRALANILGK